MQISGRRLEVRMGEIKSGQGKKDAIQQLLKRLCVVFQAAQALLPEGFTVALVGEVFALEAKWIKEQPTSSELVGYMTEMELTRLDNIEVVISKVV